MRRSYFAHIYNFDDDCWFSVMRAVVEVTNSSRFDEVLEDLGSAAAITISS